MGCKTRSKVKFYHQREIPPPDFNSILPFKMTTSLVKEPEDPGHDLNPGNRCPSGFPNRQVQAFIWLRQAPARSHTDVRPVQTPEMFRINNAPQEKISKTLLLKAFLCACSTARENSFSTLNSSMSDTIPRGTLFARTNHFFKNVFSRTIQPKGFR